ncbi:MAG: FKBP-type peptidyl-prolyl cis-trans isomerase [Coriobacteriia bacterium]|nr:FKBP-type peptidyl-prolyl cis-trans isomerase [Coriobacteriia bacterium]MCL2537178.1 FKBP-type peptidyl-prolyl cis-trans isomerase [Coriobacteriia bacterium]
MKKTVLIVGVLLGAMMMLTACSGTTDETTATDAAAGAADIVEAGDTVSVEYTGRLSDGTEFDSSAGGPPLTFVAGAGMMIPGFDNAVVGMKLGEEKTVEIPSAEAYGEQGAQNPQTGEYIIPPNEDITFDIKVVDIQKADTAATTE